MCIACESKRITSAVKSKGSTGSSIAKVVVKNLRVHTRHCDIACDIANECTNKESISDNITCGTDLAVGSYVANALNTSIADHKCIGSGANVDLYIAVGHRNGHLAETIHNGRAAELTCAL